MRFDPKHAIIGTVAFLFIVPAFGFMQTYDPKILVWFVLLPVMGWTVWRMGGSQMRKHGGRQMGLPLVALVAGLLLLAACKGTGNDAVNRRRAERFGAATPTAQAATAPAQQAAGDVAAAVDLPAVSIERDGNPVTQFVIVGLALLLGFPMFWAVTLKLFKALGARS